MTVGGADEKQSHRAPAVFVSYASQDEEAAGQICEALRAAGVEVWFDKSELRGGDAWDQKIRQQVRDCTLFLPIISQSTQARAEGYFRLEWRLADQRTHLMGRSRAFLVPVCVDATPEKDADVPDSFSAVQWTRLPEGVPTPGFLSRIGRLLDQPAAAAATVPPLLTGRVPAAPARQRRWIGVGAAVIVSVAAIAFYVSVDLRRELVAPSSTAPVVPPQTVFPAIPEKSVAVLPFTDMSEKKDQEYFSDGLSEELINMLTKVPDLRVPARTSSFYFKGKQATIAEIATALSVAHVLEGSVRKSGNTLRITAQLIRVDNGYHMWSQTYDRKLDDVFKVQDEIADAVVKALKAALLETAATRSAPTSSVQAYTLYLQAREIWTGGTQADFERASEYLRRAINMDPAFAQAWATLAQIRMDVYLYFEETARYRDVRADVLRSAAEALRLDPSLSDAHLAMGRLLNELDWNWRTSEIEFKRAIALDPKNTLALRNASNQAVHMGRLDEALQYAQSAVTLDPLQAANYSAAGNAYWQLGSLKDAESSYRKAVELNETAPYHHYEVGLLLLAQGHASAALGEMQQETFPTYRQHGLILVFDALGRSGDADGALASFEKTYALSWAYAIVEAYAARGDIERAFTWLDRAYRQHDVGLFAVKTDPLLKNLASDPRYTTFLRKMKLAE
jgi:TolB-like protein/Tfp pilus assembly protein PilF